MSDTTCRSCDAPVIFVASAKTGKPMILDAHPGKGIILFDQAFHGIGEVLDDPDTPDATARVVNVYTDHHVTCPKAAEWKGRTRKNTPAGTVSTTQASGGAGEEDTAETLSADAGSSPAPRSEAAR